MQKTLSMSKLWMLLKNLLIKTMSIYQKFDNYNAFLNNIRKYEKYIIDTYNVLVPKKY